MTVSKYDSKQTNKPKAMLCGVVRDMFILCRHQWEERRYGHVDKET